jgi:hypothetical protein
MCVTNFPKTYEFYTSRFNFSPSDVSENTILVVRFYNTNGAVTS